MIMALINVITFITLHTIMLIGIEQVKKVHINLCAKMLH